ncbi:MAG: hypothetical protein MZV63_27985 [Marinilabiliales bacterium]|nr:hypothetical protein [Marinilabiliales bacterium]
MNPLISSPTLSGRRPHSVRLTYFNQISSYWSIRVGAGYSYEKYNESDYRNRFEGNIGIIKGHRESKMKVFLTILLAVSLSGAPLQGTTRTDTSGADSVRTPDAELTAPVLSSFPIGADG